MIITTTGAARPTRGTRMRSALAVVLLAVATPLAIATPSVAAETARTGARDTSVLDWNRYAFEALGNPTADPTLPGAGQPPNVASLHIAMVQGAVYDAVNSIASRHEPYLKRLPRAPRWASQPAAVAQAAHDVLVGLTNPQTAALLLPAAVKTRVDELLAQSLAAIPDGPSEQSGVAAGRAAATAMLAARAGDGRYLPLALTAGDEPGEWRPAPPGFVSDPNAWISKVQPFVIKYPAQFRTKGPLDVTSRAYAREYDEVKLLGAANGPRNAEQEAVAQFFRVNSLELPHRTFRSIAIQERLDTAEQARLFAQLGLAGADAVIGCWNEKVYWAFWRPITAIHEGDRDGNRWTVGDEAWTPLETTPPYSDHTSGYNCITAATMFTGKAFFGTDRMSFDVVKVAGGDVVRHYDRFSDVVRDTIEARVLQGIHFRTADEQGASLGQNVANWVDRHALRTAH